jgi:hypothetical protein
MLLKISVRNLEKFQAGSWAIHWWRHWRNYCSTISWDAFQRLFGSISEQLDTMCARFRAAISWRTCPILAHLAKASALLRRLRVIKEGWHQDVGLWQESTNYPPTDDQRDDVEVGEQLEPAKTLSKMTLYKSLSLRDFILLRKYYFC